MQNSKRLILAACLAVTVSTAGLTGCHTEDRTAGRYLDDRLVARRIEANLHHDPVYKYPDVKVNVFDGVAQLSGFVDSQQQITAAANHAARADGVRQVINDITLKPQFRLVPTGTATGRQYDGSNPNYKYDMGNDNPNPQRAPIVTPNHNVAPTQGAAGNTGNQ